VGSTALSTRLDPEDMREIISAYHRCCAEQITGAGGFVAKYMGDGVLAYFGYPLANEDDAEQAVQAALAVIHAVPKLQLIHNAALQVRIGIATGMVVVGDLVGQGEAQERGVVGETPNLAARLQALAEPGRVVISEGTRRLTRGLFEYHDLGRISLKGLIDPVQAWQVLGARAVQGRFEAQHEASLTPLVGRDEELDLLLRRWRQASSGEGRVVLLAGEPGIGKSRLVVALEERLKSEPRTRLLYFCSPHHQDSSFFPVAAQLERAAGFERSDVPDAKLSKLESMLVTPSGRERDIQLVAELLSIPTADRYPSLDWSPRRKKEETLEALLRQLDVLSRLKPVFMIYEDVHWIDPSSRELLDMIVERVASLPVLLVITFRPSFQPPWTGPAHVSTLSLSRLSRREGAALAALVASDSHLPNDIAADIVERTDGIPLFVEELTKAVLEAGAHEDRREIVTKAPPAVPTTLHASLVARLDHLGPRAKEIAQVAAVIGREFSYEVLAPVAQKTDDDLQSALGRLRDAGLLFCRGTPPRATFFFKHALVRDAAYGTLLRRKRQLLHARIASVLKERFPDVIDQQPELLAQHWTEAGSTKEAIAYWIKAGRLSHIRSALVEAMAQLRKGLALLPSLVDSPMRSRQELELQSLLGLTIFFANGDAAPEAGEAFLKARACCDQLGDKSSLGELLQLQGSHHLARAEFTIAHRIAEELLHEAREHNHAAHEVHAHQCMGRSLHFLGAFTAAVEHFEDALKVRVPDMRDEPLWYMRDETVWHLPVSGSRLVALQHLPIDLILLGYPDQAAARSAQGLRFARKFRHPHLLAVMLSTAAAVERVRGADQTALNYATEVAAIGTEQRFPLCVALADLHRASILSARGEITEGLALARQASANFAAIAQSSGQTWRLLELAYCCERAGQIDEALELLSAALERANTTEERCVESELYRRRAEWLLVHHRATQGETEGYYQRALTIARTQQAKFWELRTSLSLAGLLRDQGKRTEARDLLAPVYGWFTEGFDTPLLQNAKALLDQLG